MWQSAADVCWMQSLPALTYKLWQGGNNPVICKEQVILRAQVALGLMRFELAAKLGEANNLGHLCQLLLAHPLFRSLMALTCSG